MRDASQPLPDRPIVRVDPGPLIAEGHAALRRAAGSPAELTVALLCFHIASEQICRGMLAEHPGCPAEEREQAWMERLSWSPMLAALHRQGLLSQEMRATLAKLNTERNDLCHRWPLYEGLPERVEEYGVVADLLHSRSNPDAWVRAAADRDLLDEIAFAAAERSRAEARQPAPTPLQPDDLLAQMLAAPM